MTEIKKKNIALQTKNLSIGYQTKKEVTTVAKEINLELHSGILTAIVGVNGIGKSTLLRTLGKVQPQLEGEIEINGKRLQDYNSLELASVVSLVLTEPLASKNMTVLELVTLGRQPYTNWIGALSENDKTKIREALERLELKPLRHKKCYELSDGQLQRVMIARALAQDTAIILLDEPTTHLDLYHKVRILKLLKSIAHETNKTIVFTTHEIEMAIQLCDTMLLLDGKTNPFGQPCELIERKAFENLFPANAVSFDSQTGSFRIEK
ncbi:ABC transporter ATP-binding protein [Maribacter halichondriae]|uniref:ABC transporter ATP-binding protein n=1 Tax=Maribacter halichondriae TaxID=2980554 RepID=UPI00235957D7|nr:ABC transporter ATP-binding protein [Maribacter sp. Hal144]